MAILSRTGQQPAAYIDGNYDEFLKPLFVERSAGGAKADYAVLDYDLAAANLSIQGIDLLMGGPTYIGLDVEIRGVDTSGQPIVLHWGNITQRETAVTDDATDHGFRFVSQLCRWHFGHPLTFQTVVDPGAPGQPVSNGQPIVFNPYNRLRDTLEGNCRATGGAYPVFLDPESCRTDAAAAFQTTDRYDPDDETPGVLGAESGPKFWTLAAAVNWLCETANPDPLYIKNPLKSDLEAVCGTATDLVREVHIPCGTWLPQALDMLLEPLGFSWAIDYFPGERWLRVFRRGQGAERTLQLQAIGAELDPALSEVERLNADVDVAASVNQVIVFGSPTKVEATFELVPAWDPLHDQATLDLLNRNHPDWDANVKYHDVHRKWALNEAGDYNDWRPLTGGAPFDLSPFFKDAWDVQFQAQNLEVKQHPRVVPTRRVFWPTLSMRADGRPIGLVDGVTVQYWDTDSETWNNLLAGRDDHQVELLRDECGIRFIGATPPMELYSLFLTEAESGEAGTEVRVRVCATVESDFRPYVVLENLQSRLPGKVPLVIDGGANFHFQTRLEAAPSCPDPENNRSLYSLLNTSQNPIVYRGLMAHAAMYAVAGDLLRNWGHADVSGVGILEGVDRHPPAIGDLVSKVAGREISLAAGANDAGTIYAQVVGLRWQIPQQQTVVVIGSFRDTDTRLARLAGR